MHGGSRSGAGRPKGVRSGSTLERAKKVEEATRVIESTLPNAFKGDAHALLMSVYKDPIQPLPLRIDAAKASIGYEKPKLAAVEHSGDAENPVAFNITSGVTRPDDTADDDPPHATH